MLKIQAVKLQKKHLPKNTIFFLRDILKRYFYTAIISHKKLNSITIRIMLRLAANSFLGWCYEKLV
jgi:hypothetical protein